MNGKKDFFYLVSLVVLVLGLTACPGDSSTDGPTNPLTKDTEIEYLKEQNNKSTIATGETIILEWKVNNLPSGGKCFLDIDPQGDEPATRLEVSCEGSSPQSPSKTTNYTLQANAKQGNFVSDSLLITVDKTEPTPTTLSINPSNTSINVGAAAVSFTATLSNSVDTIRWSLTGAGSIPANSQGTTVNYTPPTTGGSGTASLTATADALTATATITITSTPTPEPVISSFTVSPSSITSGESVSLNWSVTNSNGFSCRVLANNIQITTGCNSSTSHSPTSSTTYEVQVREDSTLKTSATRTVVVNPIPSPNIITITRQINSSSDDAEEFIDGDLVGQVNVTSTDLDIGDDSFGTGNRLVGLRFTNVNLPENAEILDAYIQLSSDDDEASFGSPSINVRVEVSANPSTYSQSNSLTSRSTTTQDLWSAAPWSSFNQRGLAQRVDVTQSVKYVLDNTAFQQGNAMAFQFFTLDGVRIAESYDEFPNRAAELVIEYSN